ncbi:flagellar basal body rod protein FlgC [Leptospira meyeri]|uniref:flagellar basal body rod protein FlgC n=1 Tax=Leptospira meyeri TaxID=29508 RepID=UPI00223E4FB6|nr:flagellar basal body rod protein FlgC [Leptospira meyeri]MCW7489139.1 flagellar basal body rod protein FlgC [Leptospira meyeri]
MGTFDSINISATGLSAQRLRMDVISNNIANSTTTRNTNGDGPFRRDRVILTPINLRTNWKSPVYPFGVAPGEGKGVKVMKIEKDMSPLRLTYDPTHPDAIQTGPKKGYVELPNINIVTEMTDMISASRSYEANVQLINGSKAMMNKAMEIGRA